MPLARPRGEHEQQACAAVGRHRAALVRVEAEQVADTCIDELVARLDAGAAVALATDFNPGSAFCESLPLCSSLASTQLKLSPAEALAACTVNAAHVLGRAGRIGRLAAGYRADVVLLDASDWRYLAYHLGADVVDRVVLGGELP